MKNKLIAFADEFGTNSFDFENQGTHFIVATIILRDELKNEITEKLEIIRKKHFQTGEIKSSKVSKNHKRRIKILEELSALDFSIYAIIVDKRKLYGEGFRFKPSFYKYLNGLLYKELYRTFPNLTLTVDEHGGNDYMNSFKKYVDKRHIRNLFSGSDFILENSKGDILIQLADFIAGTLGFSFDELKKNEYSETFLEIIQAKAISYNYFPRDFNFKEFQESANDNNFNSDIAELSYNRAVDFIDTTKGKEREYIDQLNCVKLLLIYLRGSDNSRFIPTWELVKHLNTSRAIEIKEQYFRTKIIGKLRDKGVLIASSRKGYKLPTCASDLKKFINHGNRIILPMAHRIKIARDSIKMATNNELDILDSDFDNLKGIIDNLR
ncbi:MAG: DUF3800 domain-containing protein [Bacteroidetes bacterium HGW-Bacteroidetes-12]|nr:MAG: DUF3800 domain-containing protein [Bacteroidetes bacterium HGW-Bacteroidetes-12]